jgi:pyruvate,water dikinase
MSWFRNIFRNSSAEDACRLLNLRCTRFRQLLRNYGRILDNLTDSAEKQSGEYVLDRQYMVSLAEVVIDLAESIIFDLNVITENKNCDFYDALGKFNNEIRGIVAGFPSETAALSGKDEKTSSVVSPERLAEAIDRAQVLFHDEGQVACRGVASGVVFNLETAENPLAFPDTAIMVAANIRPDDELIRVMKKASAILTEFGEPAGDTALLAREFQIPMIVGIKGASSSLVTGCTITVDADENTIYMGKVQEILDYYESERLPVDEEPEYKLLRKLRQSMFLLTLTDSSKSDVSLHDCRSMHDLVHFASELAGDALVDLAVNRTDLKTTYTKILSGYPIPVHVMDAGDGLVRPAEDGDQPDLEKVRSLPLLAFISGLKEADRYPSKSQQPDLSSTGMLATIKEEHANIIMLHPPYNDIVDSLIGESRESNHIYCRFATMIRDEQVPESRGVLTHEILSRLNFAAARTPRATSAWIAGLPLAEMKDRMSILGRLSAFLRGMNAAEQKVRALDEVVEDFMEQYV